MRKIILTNKEVNIFKAKRSTMVGRKIGSDFL